MKSRRNHALWAGPLLATFAFLSYYTIFYRWPSLRDFPWLNLLLFVGAIALSWFGLRRARPAGGWRRAAGFAGTAWSVLLTALFAFYCFSLSNGLPPAGAALEVGKRIPGLTLSDDRGQPRQLGQDQLALLIFYRGHW